MAREHRIWIVSVCLALSLSASADLSAQERAGTLAGTVRDATGAGVPAATVTAVNHAIERTIATATRADGSYRLNELEPGRYTVRVTLTGFVPTEVNDVIISLGKVLALDVTLSIMGLAESIEVVAPLAPLVDVRTTTVTHNVSAEEFSLLPKTRTFQSIALAAPAVNGGEIEGGLQVNGASAAENAFTIDGVATNSLIHARARQNAAFEYLQEVQVKTTGIDAEYGGALGAVISAVTKSGGNTLQGEAHYFYQGSPLAAAPLKRLVLSPLDDTTVSYVQDAKQPEHHNEIGGSIGGPIAKDRLFFFGSVAPLRVRRTNAYSFANGTAPGSIAQTQLFTQAFGKVSVASRRVNGSAGVLFTPSSSEGTLPPYDSVAPNAIASSQAGNRSNEQRGFETRNTSLSGHLTVVLAAASFLELRAAYFHDNYADTGIPNITSVIYQTSNIGLPGVPAALQGPTGTQNTPRAIIVDHDTTRRGAIDLNHHSSFSAAGRHLLKAGVGFQHTVNDVEAAYPGGYVFLYWGRTFSFGGTTGRGAYGYYEVHDRGIRGVARANMTTLYLQDQWTPIDRLTLNLGLRTENERIPTYRPDLRKYALTFGFADKIAPRLGAAYDVKANGRFKLYASWGRYYDWTKYELPRDSFGADFWTIRYRALDTLDVNTLSLDNMPGADLWIVPGSFRDQRVANFDRVDSDITPTYQDSTSAGIEYQLGKTSVLTATYVHNDLRQVIDDVGSLVNGNSVSLIANPGRGSALLMPTSGPTTPFPTPKVKRLYDAATVTAARRFSNNWFASASYTYSRLYGNYGGLASSDEIRTPTTGASFKTHQQQAGSIANPGGSVNNAWNLDQLVWDAHGHLDVVGRLATDRPHVMKAYGAWSTPFGTDVGLSFYAGSGTPISTYVNTTAQAEVFVNGRGDMGRTPVLSETNLLLSHTVRLAGRRKLRAELTVMNLFNQKTVRHIFNYLNRGAGIARASSAIDLSRTNLAAGYDYHALILATPDGQGAYDPRYGMSDLFNEGRQAQFMLKLVF